MELKDTTGLKAKQFENRIISEDEILEFFNACDAYWMHNDDTSKPHAELTSGLCSNGFFDCIRVLKYVNLSEILANQLALKIRNVIGNQKIDWVIASPMAGITFGHDVARALDASIFMFTEKDPINKGKMIWNRVTIPEDATVLQIEELTTTAKTLNAVQDAVNTGNKTPVNWLPYVGIFVHRPVTLPIAYYGDRKVISLIEKEIWAIEQNECSLCKAGSQRFKPKANWNELTGK